MMINEMILLEIIITNMVFLRVKDILYPSDGLSIHEICS